MSREEAYPSEGFPFPYPLYPREPLPPTMGNPYPPPWVWVLGGRGKGREILPAENPCQSLLLLVWILPSSRPPPCPQRIRCQQALQHFLVILDVSLPLRRLSSISKQLHSGFNSPTLLIISTPTSLLPLA